MNQQVAKVTKVNIWLQDLTKNPVQLSLVGYVRDVDEASGMLKVLYECDAEARVGKHAYFFTCETAQ